MVFTEREGAAAGIFLAVNSELITEPDGRRGRFVHCRGQVNGVGIDVGSLFTPRTVQFPFRVPRAVFAIHALPSFSGVFQFDPDVPVFSAVRSFLSEDPDDASLFRWFAGFPAGLFPADDLRRACAEKIRQVIAADSGNGTAAGSCLCCRQSDFRNKIQDDSHQDQQRNQERNGFALFGGIIHCWPPQFYFFHRLLYGYRISRKTTCSVLIVVDYAYFPSRCSRKRQLCTAHK